MSALPPLRMLPPVPPVMVPELLAVSVAPSVPINADFPSSLPVLSLTILFYRSDSGGYIVDLIVIITAATVGIGGASNAVTASLGSA